jgi:hypothetical protein
MLFPQNASMNKSEYETTSKGLFRPPALVYLCQAQVKLGLVKLAASIKKLKAYKLQIFNRIPLKNYKFPFQTPERPTSVHKHHIYVYQKYNS